MPTKTRTVRRGPRPNTVRTEDGAVLEVPAGWALQPPGDAALTRRLKAGGPTWTVMEKRGRREMSQGVWAPAARVEAAQAGVARMRTAPDYERKLAAGRARSEREQVEYVREFTRQVLRFLGFHPRYEALARTLAELVAVHATPVGSGTVARTARIPVDQRAEAAVIAWMRHQTTAYDHMQIERVKGKRREVRRELAQRSRGILDRYRRGLDVAPGCPLGQVLEPAPATAPPAAPSPAAPRPKPTPSPRPAPLSKPAPILKPTPSVARPAQPTPAPQARAVTTETPTPTPAPTPQLSGRAASDALIPREPRGRTARDRTRRR